MINKFDELAKGLAQSATRRQALKKFGVGLAGMALACFGLANRTEAGGKGKLCCLYFAPNGGGWYTVCVTANQGCPAPQPGSVLGYANPVQRCADCPSPYVPPIVGA